MSSRYRTKDERIVTHEVRDKYIYMSTNCNGSPAWILNSPITTDYFHGRFRSMTDTLVPGFHRRAKRGEVFFNPLSFYDKTVSSSPGTGAEWKNTYQSCTGYPYPYFEQVKYVGNQFDRVVWAVFGRDTNSMQNGGPDVISQSDITAAIQEACTSCASQRVRSESNLYETLAEFEKTLGLLDNIFRNLRNVVRLKRNVIARAQDASSAYLAYRYGLRPLMMDVETIVTGLRKKVGKLRVSSRGRVSLSGTASYTTDSSPFDNALITTLLRSTKHDVTVRALSLDEFDVTAAFNTGFSAKGLVTLPWELLPYSFVIDWFANVGDFIGSMVPVLDALQLGSCYTVESRTETTYAATNCRSASSSYSVVTPITGVMHVSETRRTRVPGLVSPSLVVKSDFRFSNVTRVLDSLALLVQQLEKPAHGVKRVR